MILRVFEVDGRDFKLFEKADQMCTVEVAEGIAAHAEPHRRLCGCGCLRALAVSAGHCCRRDCHCTQSKEGTPLK